jgi:hypothetical protein
MRAVTMGSIAFVLMGCSRPADKPAETADADVAETAEAPPAGVALGDMAGTWNVRSTLRDDPSKSVTYDLTATADTSGWSITFPKRDPIPLRIVAVYGDSVVSEAGPFASEMRKGQQAHSRVVTRLRGDKIVGTVNVRYEVSGPDSAAVLDLEGTRK